jgi:hypothetical protein
MESATTEATNFNFAGIEYGRIILYGAIGLVVGAIIAIIYWLVNASSGDETSDGTSSGTSDDENTTPVVAVSLFNNSLDQRKRKTLTRSQRDASRKKGASKVAALAESFEVARRQQQNQSGNPEPAIVNGLTAFEREYELLVAEQQNLEHRRQNIEMRKTRMEAAYAARGKFLATQSAELRTNESSQQRLAQRRAISALERELDALHLEQRRNDTDMEEWMRTRRRREVQSTAQTTRSCRTRNQPSRVAEEEMNARMRRDEEYVPSSSSSASRPGEIAEKSVDFRKQVQSVKKPLHQKEIAHAHKESVKSAQVLEQDKEFAMQTKRSSAGMLSKVPSAETVTATRSAIKRPQKVISPFSSGTSDGACGTRGQAVIATTLVEKSAVKGSNPKTTANINARWNKNVDNASKIATTNTTTKSMLKPAATRDKRDQNVNGVGVRRKGQY